MPSTTRPCADQPCDAPRSSGNTRCKAHQAARRRKQRAAARDAQTRRPVAMVYDATPGQMLAVLAGIALDDGQSAVVRERAANAWLQRADGTGAALERERGPRLAELEPREEFDRRQAEIEASWQAAPEAEAASEPEANG